MLNQEDCNPKVSPASEESTHRLSSSPIIKLPDIGYFLQNNISSKPEKFSQMLADRKDSSETIETHQMGQNITNTLRYKPQQLDGDTSVLSCSDSENSSSNMQNAQQDSIESKNYEPSVTVYTDLTHAFPNHAEKQHRLSFEDQSYIPAMDHMSAGNKIPESDDVTNITNYIYEAQNMSLQCCDAQNEKCNSFPTQNLQEADFAKIGNAFQCMKCEKIYARRYSWERHYKWKHLMMFDYSCHVCDVEFGEKRQLDRHIKRKHSDTTAPAVNNVCGDLSSVSVAKDKSYGCIDCNDEFKSPERLVRHISQSHWSCSSVVCRIYPRTVQDVSSDSQKELQVECPNSMGDGNKSAVSSVQDVAKTKTHACTLEDLNVEMQQQEYSSVAENINPVPAPKEQEWQPKVGEDLSNSNLMSSDAQPCTTTLVQSDTNVGKQTKHVCKLCGRQYQHLKSVQRHINQFHFKKYPCFCSFCDKPIEDKGKLRKHIHKYHSGGLKPVDADGN